MYIGPGFGRPLQCGVGGRGRRLQVIETGAVRFHAVQETADQQGGQAVARVVVDVMLKPEISDAQGQAIARKLPQMGFEGITSVRQGKRFEVELEGPADEAALDRVRKITETLLANPVIETFELRVE
jgi:phosphoribosylformylglycinamidine synthase